MTQNDDAGYGIVSCGDKYRGEFEDRLKKVIDEVSRWWVSVY